MFARRHSNRLSSTLEQRLRISSALMLHFFLSAVYITRKLGENDDVFKLAMEIFSTRKTLISEYFDKLAFSLNNKFDDGIFSHADTLTGCPLDANIIKFRAYRRLICCYPPRMSRETWVAMSMAFSSSMKIFFRTSYVPGMHVVVFTQSSSVARALASTPICCSILQYTKRTKPSAGT